jgi:hypothetical protein
MALGRILVLLCCSSLAACGGQAASQSSPGGAAVGTPARSSTTTTELTSLLPTPIALTSPATAADSGLGPFTCNPTVNRAASGSGLAQPTTARVGGQPGFDRIVFAYAGSALPSLSITSVTPPFVRDPSGQPVTVAGKVFLGIVFRNVPGIVSGYSGPTSFKAGLPLLTDLELSGDFEGVQQWVAGLSQQACVRVFALTSPTRLVVDLASASPGLPKSGQKPSSNRP